MLNSLRPAHGQDRHVFKRAGKMDRCMGGGDPQNKRIKGDLHLLHWASLPPAPPIPLALTEEPLRLTQHSSERQSALWKATMWTRIARRDVCYPSHRTTVLKRPQIHHQKCRHSSCSKWKLCCYTVPFPLSPSASIYCFISSVMLYNRCIMVPPENLCNKCALVPDNGSAIVLLLYLLIMLPLSKQTIHVPAKDMQMCSFISKPCG